MAKTKCHFIRSGRSFPSAEQGCILNPREISGHLLSKYNLNTKSNPCLANYHSDGCENLKNEIVSKCTDSKAMASYTFSIYHADLNHIGLRKIVIKHQYYR